MHYGLILKKYRVLSGYSQTEMADQLNLHQTAVSKIENGQRVIDLVTFIRWGQLVCNKDDLLKEVGLLEGRSLGYVGEDIQSVFFGLIKKEMMVQTASLNK